MRPDDSYKAASERLLKESSLEAMILEDERLNDAVCTIDFDPRFNSINWMFDCFLLAREIAYSYCWMSAYADEVLKHHADADKEFHIQYYADNCITRVNSFRDKAALLAWAYYCPFNPNKKNEVLGFGMVLERLQYPVRFGLTIKHPEEFVAQLDRLRGPHFDLMTHYRHLKIHRIEPKILMRPPRPSDGLSYMVPLFTDEEIRGHSEQLKKMYPDDSSREVIEKGCYIRGVLFDRIRVKREYWDYAEVEEAVRKCTHTCVDVAKELSQTLRRRAPLRER